MKVKLSVAAVAADALFNEKFTRRIRSACANEIAICTRDAAKQI